MKIKQAMRYQLHALVRPTVIFLAISIFTYVVSSIIFFVEGVKSATMNGAEMSVVIFLFIMGMNSFKPQFHLFLQNGLSRKTLLFGFLLSALALSAAMMLLCSIYPRLFPNLHYESLFDMSYKMEKGFAAVVTGAAWQTLLYFAALCGGFLITTLYYRVNRLLKVVISAGVPLILLVAIPIAEGLIPTFHFYASVFKFISWALGGNGSFLGKLNPYRPLLSFTALSGLCAGLSFLLLRRATIKEA